MVERFGVFEVANVLAQKRMAAAAELLSKPDVDGGLIGGASLHAGKFCEIVEAATKG